MKNTTINSKAISELDKQYIREICNGNYEHSNEFAQRCVKLAKSQYKACGYDLGDSMEEDYAQECFIAGYKNLKNYNEAYCFSTYFAKICRSVYGKMYHKLYKKDVVVVSINETDDEDNDMSEKIAGLSQIEDTAVGNVYNPVTKVMEYINYGIKDNYKKAVVYTKLKGLSQKEASEILGVSQACLNNWNARGINDIKKYCTNNNLMDELMERYMQDIA